MRISKVATLLIGLLAILLGIAFKSQNVAYMIALVVGIAASSNFPLLVLAIYWRGLTTRGAIAGGLSRLVGSIVLTITGPSIWVSVLGNAVPLVPLDPPTLVTMPRLRRLVGVSLLDRSRQGVLDRSRFADQSLRAMGGGLAAGAAD